MGQVFDKADFQRRLDAAENVPAVDEQRLVMTGQADIASTMRQARENALLKVRMKCIAAIRAADQRMRDSHLLPVEIEQDSSDDDLVRL